MQIQGTLYFFNISSLKPLKITIGCKTLTLSEWEEKGLEIARKVEFSDSQIEEYKSYIELAKKLYQGDL